MRRSQFEFRKITSARAKIGTDVSQHIDQLKGHAVEFAESQHLILAQAGEIPDMPETEPRPKLTDTTGNQIRVFIQIDSGSERANFLRIIESLQIEHLAASDFAEHDADVVTIGLLDLVQPIKAIRQRFEQSLFVLVHL